MIRYILFFLVLLVGLSCVREECRDVPKYGEYEFEIPVTLSPAKDTFHIGDTIQVVSVFPDEVYDRQTGKKF